jgi:cell division septum initiation protein DivIVA
VLEIVESEFVSKRVLADTCERLQSGITSLKSTIAELSEQISTFRCKSESSISNIQRDVARLREDCHRDNSMLTGEVAAVKDKLTTMAAAAAIRAGLETQTWGQHT